VSRQTPRRIAGAAVLLILLILGVLLIPPYLANWRLQSYVNSLADDPATSQLSSEGIKIRVLDQAAALGLPVRREDVRVAVSPGLVKIDVLYIVHVDLIGYAIDLHFRPAAGA
jgi:hypothetical protein